MSWELYSTKLTKQKSSALNRLQSDKLSRTMNPDSPIAPEDMEVGAGTVNFRDIQLKVDATSDTDEVRAPAVKTVYFA